MSYNNKIGWRFDNTYSKLPGSMLTKLAPTPVKAPELVVLNHSLSKDLVVELTRKMDKLCLSIETVKERQDEMLENVSKIKEAVYNPDEGLYARIRALESWKNTSSKILWTLFTAVIGLTSALALRGFAP